MFSIENLSVGYDGKLVVKNAGFHIKHGEFAALLGLNGSGKTTLLKASCGLIAPAKGQIVANGVDCTRLSERRRARLISYIPQRHSALKGISVLNVVLMGLNPQLGLLARPTDAHRGLALGVLRQMGLLDMAEKDFASLSEGQKQLVILSRVLVQDTPVLLMDEPDSALDFLNRHKMLCKIRSLIHNEGKAGLMASHDPNMALAYCDKLILMHNGEIVADMPLAGANRDTVQHGLSKIYADIQLVNHGNRFVMFRMA